MARLAFATLIVLAAIALVATFVAGVVATRRDGTGNVGGLIAEGSAVQKVAFLLLVMLILYVSASGGA